MSLNNDLYYIRVISNRLERFHEKSDKVFAFRCPICGDSKKSKSKTRGYFYKHPKANNMAMMCHNCGASMLFPTFLKQEFPDVYKDYAMDEFSRGNVGKVGSKVSTEDFHSSVDKDKRFSIPEHTERISNLDEMHPAYQYVQQRLIPKEQYAHLFYTDNFKEFLKQFDKEYDAPTTPRIILPFYDREYNLKGFQGRAMPWNFQELRYITIKLDESFPKLYGLHSLPKNPEKVYVLEGPIDSMFLPNAVAMMGADLDHSTILQYTNAKNLVYVFDNEPRNSEIRRRVKSRIDEGHSVVLWPKYLAGMKDINQMILKGYSTERIKDVIDNWTYDSAKAKLMFGIWSRKL